MVIEKIGRYEIIEELGRGAMGVVYKARDPNIGRLVALKTMRLDVAGLEHDEILRRFRHEARAAGRMNHPNLVIVHDAEESDGLFYIAMEYIQGETLYSILARQKTLPIDKIIEYSRHICAGLDYAHSMGVIHRDVKPANIMITPQGTAKIMDFGVAKIGAAALTQDGSVVGTPDCMSPEQVQGRPLDGRSDLFSYGVVLYQMITGTKPYIAEDVTAVIYKIIHTHPTSPRELDPTIHPGLSAIALKSLAKNPDDRYQNGVDLMHDLENYVTVNSVALAAAERSSKFDLSAPITRTSHPNSRQTEIQRKQGISPWIKWGITLLAWSIVIAAFMAPTPLRDKTRMVINRAMVIAEQKAGQGRLASLIKRVESLTAGPTASDAAPRESVAPGSDTAANESAGASPQSQTSSAQSDSSSPSTDNSSPALTSTAAPGVSTAGDGSANPVPLNKDVGHATVQFGSVPTGASVEIDGRSDSAWVTPFVVAEVPAGTHKLTFTKTGYLTERREIEVGPGQSNYNVTLTAVGATLNISSEPKGAQITVDGNDTGRITPTQLQVANGEHRIFLSLAKYRPAAVTVQVQDGQVFNYAPVLQLANTVLPPAESRKPNISPTQSVPTTGIKMGIIDVRSTPPGAYIVINGRNSGKSTPQHMSVPLGRYFLTLKLDGYKPVTQIIDVQEGKPVIFNQNLEPN
jgi:serine/threonine-protein kinase